jgi:secreted protein with Ig-like and vWFA domain
MQAREAIAAFVDGNAHRLEGWLDEVANGVYHEGDDKWLVAPQPAKAFELFQSVVEYHIPKLARSEINGTLKVGVTIQATQHDESL